MREIQLVCVSLTLAVLVKMVGPAMVAGFVEQEKRLANEAFAEEVEKAKRTSELNRK